MPNRQKWDKRFFDVCKLVASWSEDPSTKVGAVITNSLNCICATGYNGLPRGVQHLKRRLARPDKYRWVVHAEANAIAQLARLGISGEGCRIYCLYLPCSQCATLIIQAGISEVVVLDEGCIAGWEESQNTALEMLQEAGVKVRKVK